jgi:hypothetical protein
MHDRKLLSTDELDGAELSAQAPIAAQSTSRTSSRTSSRANFWVIMGFCVTGLICSMYVPSSYLNLEQTAALLTQAPI